MTLNDWQDHVTSKGVGQNDAVRMLNDARAEIERLRVALSALVESMESCLANEAAASAYRAGLGASEWEAFMPQAWHDARRALREVEG